MRRGSLFWGLLLVLIGLILMLDNLGLLGNINIWNIIWPTLLIMLGARILYGTLFRQAPASEHRSIPLDGAHQARIKFQHAAGRLNVYSGGQVDTLVEGDFGGGVEVDTQRQGETLSVKMSVPKGMFPFDWMPGGSLDWSVGLSEKIPVALEFETGAGEARIDLRDLKVSEIHLKSGASSTEIELPANASSTRVIVDAGVASVLMRVPSGVAARIRSEGGLSSIDVDPNRFPLVGSNLHQSAGYETAENKVEMEIHMGVGSVKIS